MKAKIAFFVSLSLIISILSNIHIVSPIKIPK